MESKKLIETGAQLREIIFKLSPEEALVSLASVVTAEILTFTKKGMEMECMDDFCNMLKNGLAEVMADKEIVTHKEVAGKDWNDFFFGKDKKNN